MEREQLGHFYAKVREKSAELIGSLSPEEYRIQSMTDVSPPWWNLGHTSWFFAKNILEPFGLGTEMDRKYEYVLNSYYIALGPRAPRANRGLLTKPGTGEIFHYRQSVDERMLRLIKEVPEREFSRLHELTNIGKHHEQQHQELFLTEIKHIQFMNPPHLRKPYSENLPRRNTEAALPSRMLRFEEELSDFGCEDSVWSWDNEKPVHKFYVQAFVMQNRPVTNGEYLEFIVDGGYSKPLLWLDNGIAAASRENWTAPLYWEKTDNERMIWTLSGLNQLNPAEPVCHVSFFEADAFARWKSETYSDWKFARLPSEYEWELAARRYPADISRANVMEKGIYHPLPSNADDEEMQQLIGNVWEWTGSAYRPYPGYRSLQGELAEYNSKFMDGQYVLRGGSAATPGDHIRITYRNFWHPSTRFQLSGFRLAKNV